MSILMCIPLVQVSHSGVEEFLWKCKLFQKLSSDIGNAAAMPSATGSSKAAEAVLNVRLQHSVGVAKKANEAAGKTADAGTRLSADSAGTALDRPCMMFANIRKQCTWAKQHCGLQAWQRAASQHR